ncbi:MAG: hypothetical protein M1827_005884 [Pycnora praestabilis]|nr:MAG: hypothetical protein M1827_005884 [Pycnora praestabilis]
MLYAFGSNGSGQLGLGHCKDVSIPTPVYLPVEAGIEAPVRLAAGGNHTLLLFSSGALYSTGANSDGRCSWIMPAVSSNLFQKVRIEQDRQVIDQFKLCSATWETSVLITLDDHVYTVGSGSKGELGQGEGIISGSTPQQVLDFPPPGLAIVDIASCMGQTVAALSNGDVYGWGNGRHGQLGEPTSIIWSPRKINNLDFGVDRFACGREFTFLVASGSGKHTVIGSDKWKVTSKAPKALGDCRRIGASWGSIFVLLETGTLLSWGRDDHGQLTPAGLPRIIDVAVGSEHVVARTQNGKLLAWGWGEHGNCGPTNKGEAVDGNRWNEVSIERRVDAKVTMIGAGYASSWAWFSD